MKVDSSDTHSYTYDGIYRLTEADYPGSAITDYYYDSVGNRRSVVEGGTTDYMSNNLNEYTDVGGRNYQYDLNGNLVGIEPVEKVVSWNFDSSSGWLIETHWSIDTGNGLARFSGATGQLGTLQQDVGIEPGKKYRVEIKIDGWNVYSADYLDLQVWLGGESVWIFYGGDNIGTYVYNDFEPSNTDNLKLKAEVDADNYLYANVDYVSVKEQVPSRYVYDCENRLTDVNDTADGPVAHYEYDYLGRRITKTTYDTNHEPQGTSHYVYDGDQIIAEYNDSGTLLRKFVYGPGIDEPVCMITASGTKYYYHFDGLGSVIALSNASHNIVEQYSYDVFGEPNRVSAVGNPYMFTGRAYDPNTGLYDYRARVYKPQIGRFLQTDPVMQFMQIASVQRLSEHDIPGKYLSPVGMQKYLSTDPTGKFLKIHPAGRFLQKYQYGFPVELNLYTYCGSNPLNFIDAYGLYYGQYQGTLAVMIPPTVGASGGYYITLDHYEGYWLPKFGIRHYYTPEIDTWSQGVPPIINYFDDPKACGGGGGRDSYYEVL